MQFANSIILVVAATTPGLSVGNNDTPIVVGSGNSVRGAKEEMPAFTPGPQVMFNEVVPAKTGAASAVVVLLPEDYVEEDQQGQTQRRVSLRTTAGTEPPEEMANNDADDVFHNRHLVAPVADGRSLAIAGSTVHWFDTSTMPAVDPVGGITWVEAENFCANQDMRLCSYSDLCPDGASNAPDGNPVSDSDQWVAIDSPPDSTSMCKYNTWVQIGKRGGSDTSRCTTHDDLGACPDWGLENQGTQNFQNHIGCCTAQWFDSSPDTLDPAGGFTWKEAESFCTAQDMRLCNYEEVCPNGGGRIPSGNPIGASAQPDQWVAIASPSGSNCEENNWVQVGKWAGSTNADGHQCKTHGELGGCPAWGTAKQGTQNFQKHISCCPDPTTPAYCYRHTYSRLGGGVELPQTCPEDSMALNFCRDQNCDEGVCFEDNQKCPAGYHKFGFDCHQDCPALFNDAGLACTLKAPATHSLGLGYWWIPFGTSQMERCEKDFGKDKCLDGGWGVVYPKCPSGYSYHIAGVCLRNEASCHTYGMFPSLLDLSKATCLRQIKSAFNLKTCAADQGEQSWGLCYKETCPDGWDSVGPNCWEAPPSHWVRCGMGAAPDEETCTAVTEQQVHAVVKLALFCAQIALKIATAGASSGTDFAALIKAFQKLVASAQQVRNLVSKQKAAYNVHNDNWLDITKPETSDLDKVRIAAQIVAVLDPTGISAIVGSFTYHQCRNIFSPKNDVVDNCGGNC